MTSERGPYTIFRRALERRSLVGVRTAVVNLPAPPPLEDALVICLLLLDRVWRTRTQLELAVVEYIGWFNDSRLHQALGDLPPSEFERLSQSSSLEISLS
jgi:transposase InsO family protein